MYIYNIILYESRYALDEGSQTLPPSTAMKTLRLGIVVVVRGTLLYYCFFILYFVFLLSARIHTKKKKTDRKKKILTAAAVCPSSQRVVSCARTYRTPSSY